jgi:hypothetical protein
LTKLYNRSLATSVFPAAWKCGKVTALFKFGDRCNANNYRLITILPTASKILERVQRAVHSQVYSYLLHENILTPKQFGNNFFPAQNSPRQLLSPTSMTPFWVI